jgi:very-short-patch-repair endonuclease
LYIPYNKKYILRARELRKKMTEEERKFWYVFLKNHEKRILRQKIIENYIVDFYCPEKKLVIEIDGNQHYTIDGLEYDNIRTEILEAHKLKVIRFTNLEIKRSFKEVCEYIDDVLS